MTLNRLVFFFLLFSVLSSCRTTYSDIGRGIEERCTMTYISETDSKVSVFALNVKMTVITQDAFTSALSITPGTQVEQSRFDAFFDRTTANHPYEGWQELRAYLEKNLTQLTVFRIGTTSPQYYVVGVYYGRPIGITFHAVET